MAAKKRATSKNGSPRAAKPRAVGRWLGQLGNYTKRALTFQTKEELHNVIDAIFDPTDDLYRMPNAPADALTMVVPEDAVPVIRARGLRFTEHAVVPAVRRANPHDSPIA